MRQNIHPFWINHSISERKEKCWELWITFRLRRRGFGVRCSIYHTRKTLTAHRSQTEFASILFAAVGFCAILHVARCIRVSTWLLGFYIFRQANKKKNARQTNFLVCETLILCSFSFALISFVAATSTMIRTFHSSIHSDVHRSACVMFVCLCMWLQCMPSFHFDF